MPKYVVLLDKVDGDDQASVVVYARDVAEAVRKAHEETGHEVIQVEEDFLDEES